MKKGFTLIELLIVILIVGVLSAFAFPVLGGSLGGCAGTQTMEQSIKHFQSGISGLDRTVTLYSASGSVKHVAFIRSAIHAP